MQVLIVDARRRFVVRRLRWASRWTALAYVGAALDSESSGRAVAFKSARLGR